jgi:hypothetical protein
MPEFEIRSEVRGFHAVAWVAAASTPAPSAGVLVVGRTLEEAENRLRERLARESTAGQNDDPASSPSSSGDPSRSPISTT